MAKKTVLVTGGSGWIAIDTWEQLNNANEG